MNVGGLTTVMEDGPHMQLAEGITAATGVYRADSWGFTFRCSVTAITDYPEKGAAVVEVWHPKALEWHEVLGWGGSSALMKDSGYTTEGISELFQRMIDLALGVVAEN